MPAKYIPVKVFGKPFTEKTKIECESLSKMAGGVNELDALLMGSNGEKSTH
jgi:hypothetical protein